MDYPLSVKEFWRKGKMKEDPDDSTQNNNIKKKYNEHSIFYYAVFVFNEVIYHE